MQPIITSKYATDGYKISMGNIFWWRNMIQGKNIQGRYQFFDRNNTVYPKGFAEELKEQTESLGSLSSNSSISNYIGQKWPFINQEYLRWYDQVFFHDYSQVDISQKNGQLRLFVEGPIHTATHFEIPLLRIISTLTTKMLGLIANPNWKVEAYNNAKTLQENNVKHSEFGGRRPFTPEIHLESLEQYNKFRKSDNGGGLLGTSWIEYAYELGLMIMGTMAHEYVELMAALYGYEEANHMAMQTWVDYYGKKLGYFLTDTYTTDNAFKAFTWKYASIFGGTRQDSGNPKIHADKQIDILQSIGIDPKTKSVIHSNTLKTIPEILDLNRYRAGEYDRSFGLGKFITNNVGHPGYNTVIKLVAVKVDNGPWMDVVKLSDDPGKSIGNPEEVIRCKKILGIS